MDLETLRREIDPHGLIVRGGFAPGPADGVPGNPAALVIVGNAGPAMWEAFSRARPGGPGPLDAWTRSVLSEIAGRVGAAALFPFDGPPYLPFQRWAMKAEAVFPSPIGPSIHPVYGLWHAYRGALAFPEPLELPAPEPAVSPCESCAEKPCLTACPVGALMPGAYDVPACTGHIAGAAGADCLDRSCAARRACPVGRDFVYAPAPAQFHMRHFLDTNGTG